MIRYVLIILAIFWVSSSHAQTGNAHSEIDLESDAGELVGEKASEAELKEFGDRLKQLILNEDVNGLKQHLEYGVQGPNDFYPRDEAFKMMDDKTSWLYRRFFTSSWSIKVFLQEHPDAVADWGGACQYYSLTFSPPGDEKTTTCSILVFKDKGTFYLWGFAVCPSYG